jgi:hypothetical protein
LPIDVFGKRSRNSTRWGTVEEVGTVRQLECDAIAFAQAKAQERTGETVRRRIAGAVGGSGAQNNGGDALCEALSGVL